MGASTGMNLMAFDLSGKGGEVVLPSKRFGATRSTLTHVYDAFSENIKRNDLQFRVLSQVLSPTA